MRQIYYRGRETTIYFLFEALVHHQTKTTNISFLIST